MIFGNFIPAASSVIRQLCWTSLLLLLLAIVTQAQSSYPTDGTTPAGLKPGAPSGSYALSGFENINLYNGSLNFRLPLLGIGGRGGAGHTITLPIEQKWLVETVKVQMDDYWETFYYPSNDWWMVTGHGYGPGVMHVRYGVFSTRNCTSDGTTRAWRTLTRLTFTAPDGTEYELRDVQSGGAAYTVPICATSGFNRGKVFVTADGSTATFISDANIIDPAYSDGSSWTDQYISGYLLLRDGTRYRIEGGYVTWMRDRNGNKINFSYTNGQVTTITDSLNRQVSVAYNVAEGGQYGTCDKITFKGFGGASRVIRVCKTSMGNVLRSGYALQSELQLFGIGSPYGTFNPTVVSAVWLPDSDGVTRRYQFRYNSYGELARVELPTGGAVEYDHAGGMAGDAYNSGVISDGTNMGIYRRVIERREYADGVNLTNRITYSRPEGSSSPTPGFVRVDQLNATGTLLGRQDHYFHGNGASQSILSSSPISYSAWDEGREYKTEAFDTNGTTLLRRVNHTWQGNGTMNGLTVNPRIVETTTTIEPSGANLVSKRTFTHDQYNNQTEATEYDYGSGVPGALVRRTATTYITTNNGYDYACDPASTCSASASIANVIHLRSLASQVSVYDAGGVERARAGSEYDNYTADANHAALTNRASISGLDSAFTTSYTTRGNTTAMTSYFLVNGSVTGSISAYGQFDIAGNVIKVIDARGYATVLYFDDCFGAPDNDARLNTAPVELSSVSQISYAFATKVTNAMNQSAYGQLDYYLGKPVNGEDPNGIVAAGFYNDALDRPTQVRRAAGTTAENQTSFSYDDANRIVSTTSDRDANNDNLLVAKVLYDNLGRTIESRQYEGGTNYIATKREYDALGRAFRISNPYRPWQSESPVWLTTTFDALGRTLTATTPDNAVVSTSYYGNQVTATDQAGKQRKSVTDALGRMTQVYEDPAGLNYLTSYSFDVLGNLTTVSQGAQTRTFAYDSLKRLTSATNPESGTSSFTHDNNGNVLTRTDARGVVTTVAYDVLNRPTTKTYNDGTPNVAYFYDNQTLPGGAPSFSRGYSIGALVAVTYGGGSAGNYSGFDALGRSVLKIQQTGGINYQTSASYNAASAMTSEVYPSGRTVSYGYDNAGRTNSVSGNLGDGVSRTYSTGISYSPFGGMTQEQFGTNIPLFNKKHYNVRGQLYDVRVSTLSLAQNEFDWNRGAVLMYYGGAAWGQSSTANNGNVTAQQHWVPANESYSDYAYTQQSYNYDSLNRLKSMSEQPGTPAGLGAPAFVQAYNYDRWGNRTIDNGATWGTGINNKQFAVDPANNRLGVPSGQSGTMSYDQVGNLTNDTYTGAGTRTYDAENRMTGAQASAPAAYSYDGAGHRIKRIVNGTETWQVYGLGGELLAEYAANTAPANPQKEYGYRNGELLITATINGGSGGGSPFSFGDDPLIVGTTSVKAAHFNELRTAINQARSRANLSAAGWTDDPVVAGVTDIKAVHVTELRARLDEARAALGLSTGGYTDPSLTSGYEIKAAHVQELRTKTNEALTTGSGSSVDIRWLIADQLGTPRIVLDQSGSLATVSRHDYLPFGEELFAGVGGRTTGMGYTSEGQPAVDGARQQFTGYERDAETGLDFAQARYYGNMQGRFTSPDPLQSSARTVNPQTWNRYSYVVNNPLKFIDPSGMSFQPGGRNISNWNGAMATAEATEGISPWPDVSIEQTAETIESGEALDSVAATAAAGTAAGLVVDPQDAENQLVFLDATGSNGTSPFDNVPVYDPVPELMNSTDQGDRLFGYIMKSGFLWYVDTITEYFDKDGKVNFNFGVLADAKGAIDFLEHHPLFKHGGLGKLHKTDTGEADSKNVFDARSIQGDKGLGKLSLQINIGRTTHRARADLDKENPYQSFGKKIKHGWRVIF